MESYIHIEFETKKLPIDCSYLAPDTSEIRVLLHMRGGGLAHCILPPHKASIAQRHKTVEEIWYFIQGQGEVWRKLGEQDQTVPVEAGICLTIPTGTHFQFKNTGEEPLCFIIATMPTWPCSDEAVRVQDHWNV